MNLSDIITKCYILALIIRDDGERLLLGDGTYEFKSSLQHFAPNIYQNDIVELQGTDGQLLAGQVRRSATQAFDGYIADGTIAKTTTEQSRRRFLAFFRKKHHYKVVYIMPDGTAVKRDRGYIVDAPAVQELYQIFPEYHIGLNFEDPNYYEYEEDSEGDEIYAHIQAIAITRELQAGLIWDALGAVSDDIAWSDYTTKNTTDGYAQITDAIATAPLSLTHLYGNAEQKTLSGKNLADLVPMTNGTITGINQSTVETVNDSTLGRQVIHETATGAYPTAKYNLPTRLESGKYYALTLRYKTSYTGTGAIDQQQLWVAPAWSGNNWDTLNSWRDGRSKDQDGTEGAFIQPSTSWTVKTFRFYVDPEQYSFASASYTAICLSLGRGLSSQNTSKEAWFADIMICEISQAEWNATTYADSDFQEFVGGIPSPNPDYPQAVNVVTGAQTVKITGKNLCYSANRVSNTTLEFFADCATIKSPNVALSFITDFTTTGNASVYSFVDGVDLHTTVGHITTTAGQRSATTLDLSAIMSQIKDGTTLRLMVYRGGSTFTSVSDAQLELGSTATPYEPYQGQSYEINLGSLELAKIGTYHDYIWNDDGTWKIHKAINKIVLNGTENWALGSMFYCTDAVSGKVAVSPATGGAIMSDYFIYSSGATADPSIDIVNGNILRVKDTSKADVATFKTWLSTHNTTVYYALATPTDTEITDSELIEQLNHIYSLYQGQNNLWLIPSAGAQGEMTVRYAIGYSDIGSGYHWNEEQGASSNIVTNDGIDSVRPLWIINGPATNPTLTNSTTGQTITWNGTVPADATLIIDMDRQTATLNGANVFAQLEGDWIELAVGPNKLQYSASGGATADSTLEWNGVIG